MVRTYKRKTSHGLHTPDAIIKAVDQVLRESRSLRSVAAEAKIPFNTLRRYVQKKKQGDEMTVGYSKTRQVFTDKQEEELEKYILTASKIYFGLPPKEIKILTLQCAKKFLVETPQSWEENGCAGVDWFTAFIKRHPNLSICVPRPTSSARATSFNPTNVAEFFTKLGDVIDRYNFQAADIWNCHETGVTTVQKPVSDLAMKGTEQVGSITSAEPGQLVTLYAAVCAIGTFVPPMLIFPRKFFKKHFIRDGPVGCIGGANPSGGMTKELFLEFIKHFVKHVRCTKEKPVLILLDNHMSHLDIEMLDFAKENGIVLLSFPPHCSHKLQPLHRTVFGQLKRIVPASQNAWMRNNPGKSMTIYDLPSIVKDCWPRAAIPANIMKGFEVSGIVPYNSEIFTKTDFAPSNVTDVVPEASSSETSVGTISPSSGQAGLSDHPCPMTLLPPQDRSNDRCPNVQEQVRQQNYEKLVKFLAEKNRGYFVRQNCTSDDSEF